MRLLFWDEKLFHVLWQTTSAYNTASNDMGYSLKFNVSGASTLLFPPHFLSAQNMVRVIEAKII